MYRGGAFSSSDTQHCGLRQGRSSISGRGTGKQHPLHPRWLLRPSAGGILLLGVSHARNTFLHSVEEVLNVPNRLTDKPLQLTVVDGAGAEHTVYMRRHYNAQQPHISEDFVKLEQAYLDCGAAKNTKFGDAACVLCDANGLFRVTRHVLAPDPEAFVTEPVIPAQRWKDMCAEPF